MQVKDDAALLKMMMEDLKKAPELYRPTNYWQCYEEKFAAELFKVGLHDFRRRNNSVLSSFAGTDLAEKYAIDLLASRLFNNRYTRLIPFWHKFLSFWNSILNKLLPITTPYNITTEDIQHLAYSVARLKAEKTNAKPIDQFDTSLAGNPEDVFVINDKAYTTHHFDYYLNYVYCTKFLDFSKVKLFVELGSGAGRQIEVLKKLYPQMTFCLYDIPPQIYVCEQYLSSVFPGQVVSYRQTRGMKTVPSGDGKIYIFGSWDFEMVKNMPVDLFWNCASFQEMEPEIVANYLSFVNKSAANVFLLEATRGQHVAKQKGEPGVLRKTTFDDYKQGLKDFKLVDLSPVVSIPKMHSENDHSISFWKKS